MLDAAIRAGNPKVFAEHLAHIDAGQVEQLRLGKKTEQLLEEAGKLHKQLDRYSYGVSIRFSETEVDQARAAGVLIEFDRAVPIIVDRPLYRELVKQAIKRTVTELADKLAAQEAQRRNSRGAVGRHQVDAPVTVAQWEEQRQLRELTEHAHGVNLDLGHGLLNGLSTIDPADINVAKFLSYADLRIGQTCRGLSYAEEHQWRATMASLVGFLAGKAVHGST